MFINIFIFMTIRLNKISWLLAYFVVHALTKLLRSNFKTNLLLRTDGMLAIQKIEAKPVILVSSPKPFNFFPPLKSLKRYCEVLAQHRAKVNIAVVSSTGQTHISLFEGKHVRTRDAFMEPTSWACAPPVLIRSYCAKSLFTSRQ